MKWGTARRQIILNYAWATVIFMFAGIPLLGQSQNLNVNSKFPWNDITMNQSSRGGEGGIHIGDQKHIIVDIFTSGCVVCFKKFPTLDSIQKRYIDKLQFVLLGKKDKYIEGIYKRFSKHYGLNFPVAFDSVVLKRLPIASYPSYIWINREGVIQAITGTEELSESNIKRFLADEPINLTAIENPERFNPDKLYLLDGNGGKETDFLFRSILTLWRIGDPMNTPVRVDLDKNKFQALGVSRNQLYLYAYSGLGFWHPGDPEYDSYYPFPVLEENGIDVILRKPDTLYNYSLFIAQESKPDSSILLSMQEDIIRYFRYEGSLEYRLMPVWSLRRSANTGTFRKSQGTAFRSSLNLAGIDICGYPINSVIRFIRNYHMFEWPIINETGVSDLIDLKFNALISDWDDLRTGLLSAGLELVPEQKWMFTVVIRKKNSIAASR